MRPWKTTRWELLPPGLQDTDIYSWMLHGLPEEIKARMGRRGHHFVGHPYPRLAYLSSRPRLRQVDVGILENDRFRLVLALGLGPRIMEIHDKKLDTPLTLPVTYVNSAMIGLTGAWFMGGIEFNAFRLGHTVFFGQDIPVEEVRFADGDRGIRFEALDELVNMRFTVTLRLFADGVSWRVELENLLDVGQPLYWWTNIAEPMGENTMLLYEPGPVANHSQDPGFDQERWPIIKGHDSSRWGGHTSLISAYWYRYRKPYFGFYEPRLGTAVLHAADTRVLKGRKLWSLGARDDTALWWSRCYERSMESYCELQAGVAHTQIEFDWIKPRETITWTESMTAFPFECSRSYRKTWNDFVHKGDDLKMLDRHGKAVHWDIKRRKPVVPVSRRQQTAHDALSALKSDDPALVRKLTSAANLRLGWRAGVAWEHVLARRYEMGKCGDWVRLQYAAALAGRKAYDEALAVLSEPPTGKGVRSGLMFRLKSAVFRVQGRLAEACSMIDRALACGNAEPLWWKEAFECYRAIGNGNRRKRLLRACPASVRKQDLIRYEAAWLYFDLGDFARALGCLEAEMLDVGEGFLDAWRLWRECLIAWGLELWQSGDIEEAYEKLLRAAQAAPQFGIGRRETDGNDVALFYRWWLARSQGDYLVARALATQELRRMPHPSSDDAMYLLRMAVAAGHASAKCRRKAIEEWRAAERAEGVKEPVWRTAILEGVEMGRPSRRWKEIGKTDLLKYRAVFEAKHAL